VIWASTASTGDGPEGVGYTKQCVMKPTKSVRAGKRTPRMIRTPDGFPSSVLRQHAGLDEQREAEQADAHRQGRRNDVEGGLNDPRPEEHQT
jgi:hypothetical protein